MKLLRVLPVLCYLLTAACTSIGYYGQSLAGQMELLRKQQTVGAILADPAADPGLKRKLVEIQLILDYAHTQLGLPDNGSYRQYVKLDHEHVVWNVFAAPEFSLQPRQWCYLIIGCTSYRGYFKEQHAREYARMLSQAGWEVSVNGISAYSTLGWLRDPLLSTMLNRDDWEIARLLFHELAHQRLYISDDTEFNEAFADAVAEIGLHKWLRQHHAGKLETVRIALEQEDDIYRLLFITRDKFDRLYRSGLPIATIREQKAELHKQLQKDYLELKRQWHGDHRYDRWMKSGINNASLAALSTYRSLVPAFEQAWKLYQEDLPRFYEWVGKLAACDKPGRLTALQHPEIEPACAD